MNLGALAAALERRPKVDVIWLFLWVSAAGVFVYSSTWYAADPGLAQRGYVGFMLLLAGTVGNLMLGGFSVDGFVSAEESSAQAGALVVSLGAIGVVNYVAPVLLSVGGVGGGLFLMLIAVAEEQFFRGFLLTLFARVSGSDLFAVAASSLAGMVYHVVVYGLAPGLMLVVFGCFAVLGFVYVASGYRLSTPMLAHAIVNILSVL